MQIKGQVVEVLPQQTFSSGSKKQTFILSNGTEDRPNKVAVDVWGEKIPLALNEQVVVDVNVSSREYNGKWYTEISAWRKAQAEAAPTPAQPVSAPVTEPPMGDDKLPF